MRSYGDMRQTPASEPQHISTFGPRYRSALESVISATITSKAVSACPETSNTFGLQYVHDTLNHVVDCSLTGIRLGRDVLLVPPFSVEFLVVVIDLSVHNLVENLRAVWDATYSIWIKVINGYGISFQVVDYHSLSLREPYANRIAE